MKNKNYPHYLDALLTKTFYPDTSKQFIEAVRYIENADKKIKKDNSKTSDKV